MERFRTSRRKFLQGISIALSSFGLTQMATAKDNEVKDDRNDLKKQLNSLINAFSGKVSLHAHNLKTNEVVSVKEDEIYTCASEAKTFILLTYAEQVATGKLDPKLRIELKEDEVVPGSGVMRFANPGLEPSVSFLAYLMMSVSDNTTTNMLMDAVGGPKVIQSTVKRLKIPNTTIYGKLWRSKWITTSARALAYVSEIIAEPKKNNYPTAAAKLCKKIMARHFEDNGLVRFLPWSPYAEDAKAMEQFQDLIEHYAGIEYYGKAGAIPGYRGDTALFITKKSKYVIGLMCPNIKDKKPLNATNEGYTFSANIGRLFYKHWG